MKERIRCRRQNITANNRSGIELLEMEVGKGEFQDRKESTGHEKVQL